MANIFIEVGHHGTYLEYFDSIKTNNFKESEDHEEWLGDGVYFFVDGKIWETTIKSAEQFAEDTRFREKGNDSLEKICVIEAKINVNCDSFLNLDIEDGQSLFNLFREETWNKIYESGKTSIQEISDYHILRQMRKEIGIEFVKKSVFIKFGTQRKLRNLHSLIPNVTIFVVSNPNKNISLDSIIQVL